MRVVQMLLTPQWGFKGLSGETMPREELLANILWQCGDELQWCDDRVTEAKVSQCGKFVIVNQFIEGDDDDDVRWAFYKCGQIMSHAVYYCQAMNGISVHYVLESGDIADYERLKAAQEAA